MRIYTRQGDGGGTGLVGGQRVSKDDVRIEAYGTIDELSAALGWAIAEANLPSLPEELRAVQHDLFVIGAQLATPESASPPAGRIGLAEVKRLEGMIDRYEDHLAPLTSFILPGGSRAATSLHVARVVCRRAERRLVTLARHSEIDDQLIPYLNRLSDLLFVLARAANQAAGVSDIPWIPPRSSADRS